LRVGLNELIDVQKSAPDFDHQLVSFSFYEHTSLAELVNTRGLASNKHYFELEGIWAVVDILCEFDVDGVRLDWLVARRPTFQLDCLRLNIVDLTL